ncbi:unnamed protein product [Diamesa serratosioi]
MKVIRLLIFASIITYAAARVVTGPQIVDSRKKLQQRQEEDSEGVVVDDVITASNIEVFEVTSPAAIVSSSEVSVEVTSAETISAETETNEIVNEDDADPINRYCKCSSNECNCCRDFTLPLVPIQGPGCASIRYLEGDKMSIGIKFGNRVLANRVISGRKDTPVCLPLPGGFSNFCGRIYGISKKGEEFKACLGLELRADEEVEAALRVSCFKFGPRGLKVAEAEPIPALPSKDDDDDDDDIFGFGGDDEEDDDDDILDDDDDDDEDAAAAQPASNDDDDDDDLQQVADDDDDDDEDEIDDEINNDKQSTYSGLTLLGFRKFFSRFFQ